MPSPAKPTTSHRRRRVFIVDDHPMVREWLASLIRQQPDLAVGGEAPDAAGALTAIAAAKPDVVIVDISLEGNSGLDLIRDLRLRHPEIKTLVLSMHDQAAYAARALRAGARGYIMKNESTARVVEAIRQVLSGRIYASPDLMTQLVERAAQDSPPGSDHPVEVLSPRELEVFRRLGRGEKTRHIAEQLNVSIKAIQVYCARTREKLGLANAAALVREAVRWVDSEHPL
jgi:DNA-binding NarL/FixJ family response regulator